jgi:carbamoyltransferase
MLVMGIKPWGHDTGAAIVADDGTSVRSVAVSEARLNRTKHSGMFPLLSIRYCLDALGLADLDDLDLVVLDRLHEDQPLDLRLQAARERRAEAGIGLAAEASIRWPIGKVRSCNHVDAHLASAYFASSFDDASILSVEGGFGLGSGRNTELCLIDRVGYHGAGWRNGVKFSDDGGRPFNIAKVYNMVSRLLGFGNFGSGKTMGLAAYKDLFVSRDPIDLPADTLCDPFHDHSDLVRSYERRYGSEFFAGADGEHLTELRVNLARQVQDTFERAILTMIRNARARTASPNLALAGGAALSCVTNQQIIEARLFDEVFIQPASSDEGVPLGCALWGYHTVLRGSRRYVMNDAYLGRPYAATDVHRALVDCGLNPVTAEPEDVAARLASGAVIARFVGCSEYGPRALGNRSILADPRDPDMTRRLNLEIKHREGFRPFAASCTAESANRYFDLSAEAPFMIVAADVREEYRETLPSITHVDHSCRPQTVRYDQNPGYHDLLRAFGEKTGHPVLVNTSFNDNDEPIVETPIDAVLSAAAMGLDALVLEDRLVEVRVIAPSTLERVRRDRNNALKRQYVTEMYRLSNQTVLDSTLKTMRPDGGADKTLNHD